MTESPDPPPPRIRAILFGVGAMGTLLTRLLVDKNVEIVGALAVSPSKVGRDLGEVVGLGHKLGVVVSDDLEALLSGTEADVAVVAAASRMEAMAPAFRTCLSHGVNVVTLEEQSFYPWHSAPELAAELDELARAHGATLTATGVQDVYWSLAVSAMMATAHRIDSVHGRSSWRADEYGPSVADYLHLGEPPVGVIEALTVEWGPMVGLGALGALAAAAGLTPTKSEGKLAPNLARRDIHSERLDWTIPAGSIRGVTETVTMQTAEGIQLSFEMAGYVHAPEEPSINEWSIHGEPELHLVVPDLPVDMVTCATLVNRIPDVLAAPPGIATVDRLPPPRYRHGPLRA